MTPAVGHVWLIGAGPGAPGLITVAGLAALRSADVVVYDRLSPPELLEEAPADALRVDVAQRPGDHALSEDDITRILVCHGLEGRRVARLKAGDPFVFGRGGEEALALAAAGVPFTVIPGVTSAIAGPGSAGIPVTHRGIAGSFAVLSGRAEGGEPAQAPAWRAIAGAVDTLVVLMAGRGLETIVAAILGSGRSPSTPAAVIERATMPGQRTMVASLSEIASVAREQVIRAPALLVVGDVVSLHEILGPSRAETPPSAAGEPAGDP